MAMQCVTRSGRDMVDFKNVQIIHRNLRGMVKEYNRSGNRSFSIILTPEEADILIAAGFNVRTRPARDGSDELFCFLPVFVTFNNYPPKVYRVCGEEMMLLNESNVGTLDSADILNVDVSINASHWNVNGQTGIKAYVNTMYVTVEEDPFAQSYAGFKLIG